MAKTKAVDQSPAIAESTALLLGRIGLPGKASTASEARKYVHGLLAGHADDRLHDALLLVTELISNALRHSESGRDPDGRITLQVADVDGFIHIQLHDQGSASSVPYVVADSGAERYGGFGMRLVEQIASEWGHLYESEGRRLVWFTLAPHPDITRHGLSGERPTLPDLMPQRAQDQMAQLAPDRQSETARARPGGAGNIRSSSGQVGGPRRSVLAARREEIAGRLADQITSGDIAEGDPIATRENLMGGHGLSLRSAQRIHQALRDRGLVHLVLGHGYMAGPPDPMPRPHPLVEEQIVHIAAVLAKKIRTGQISPHQRVATVPQLMKEHGVSKWVARKALSLLRARGYAYDEPRKNTKAAPSSNWPPPDTSMEEAPPPHHHVPKLRHPKPQPAPTPEDQTAPSPPPAQKDRPLRRVGVAS